VQPVCSLHRMSYTPPDQVVDAEDIAQIEAGLGRVLAVVNARLANSGLWSIEHQRELKRIRRKLEKAGRLAARLREEFL
jgi:hypothetical protein